ncbi:MAG: caspase family protein [Elusimicrobia bacterium]|nr:caspase family protein [Elusimicrobiota bacterium]
MPGARNLAVRILSAACLAVPLAGRAQNDPGLDGRRDRPPRPQVWSQWNQPPGAIYDPDQVNLPAPAPPAQGAATIVVAPGPRLPAQAFAPGPRPGGLYVDYGPRRPPEFVEFGDEFTRIVTEFVADQARKNRGAFVVKDDRDGSYHYLKLARVFRDRITRLSPTEVFGCVEFEGMGGTSGKYDLDFYLTNEAWAWKVSKLLIHKVDGQARFHYTSDHVAVALAAPAAPGSSAAPKPAAPAGLSAAAVFRSAGVLRADAPAQLVVTVSNAGPGPAYAVRLVPSLRGDVPGLALPEAVELGDIPAGSTTTAAVALTGSWDLRTQKARLKLSIQEANGFDADPLNVEFQTRAVKPPSLQVAGVKLGRGSVQAGEAAPISVTVANAGGGAAQAVRAALELGSPDIFMSGEPAIDLGVIRPGESKTAQFEFFVKKRYQGTGSLPIAVALSEATGRYGLPAQSLQLSLGRGAPAAGVVGVPAEAELEDVDVPPAVRTKADREAYAVVVGVERYRDIPAVEFAARDAQSVYDYLTQAMGFDPKNVVHLADERATRTDLATYLGPWLKDRVTAKSRVFIYFSGHGSPDPVTGEGYIIPYDGSPNYVQTTALALKQLYDDLSRLPARDVTVVLDSCFSGAGGRSLLARGVRPLVNVKLAVPGANSVVLSAAQGGQISGSYPEAQHGIFTYFLLKGLHGGADADRNGAVTTAELFSYLRPEVERAARLQHVEQSPALAPELSALGDKAGREWLRLK